MPFESILDPLKHMGGKTFVDMESNPRVALPTASVMGFSSEGCDFVYNVMSRNFFGAVPSFFLKNSELTSIKSEVITNGFVFPDNETYMMRITMNRSAAGTRTYVGEQDVSGNMSALDSRSAYSTLGARYLSGALGSGTGSTIQQLLPQQGVSDKSHTIPQDPLNSSVGNLLGGSAFEIERECCSPYLAFAFRK